MNDHEKINVNNDEPYLGIDFGTTQSSMAWFNPSTGQAEVIRNAEAKEKTPSVVYFGDDEILVGNAAEDMLEIEQERNRVITSVKRDLARRISYQVGNRTVSPVQVVAEILRKLRIDAEEGHFHKPVEKVILTHPANFDQSEKDLLIEAAKVAGFSETALLPEPVAAAIAYTKTSPKVADTLLIYDFGGGTLDLAVMKRDESEEGFSLFAEPRGIGVGGDDLDRALYDFCDTLAKDKLGRSISVVGSLNLQFLRDCRKRKENLSSRTKGEFSSYLPGGILFRHAIERSEFEAMVVSILQPTINLARKMQDECKAKGLRIDAVVLIGGSSQIPLVKKLIAESLQLEPVAWHGRELAVAVGAAYHANALLLHKEAGEVKAVESIRLPTCFVEFEDYWSFVDRGMTTDLENRVWLEERIDRIETWKGVSDSGNREAMVLLGKCYQLGAGVQQSHSSGLAWYRKSAELGCTFGMYCLAAMFERGLGVERSYSDALEWYKKSSDAGNYHAMFYMALTYWGSDLVEKNIDEWEKYLCMASEAGSLNAISHLGLVLQRGGGYEAARTLFSEAISRGHITAKYNLGVVFRDGVGVASDLCVAANWFEQAAEAGHLEARIGLADIYRMDTFVKRCPIVSMGHLLIAAGARHPKAMYKIAVQHFEGIGRDVDYTAALDWLLKAKECGSLMSCVKIAEMFAEGIGVAVDKNIAIENLERAAQYGLVDAMHKLGVLLIKDDDLRNPLASKYWLQLAAERKNVDAMVALAWLYMDPFYAFETGGFDYSAAEKWFIEAAEAGCVDTMVSLYMHYKEGLFFSKDLAKAMYWKTRAVENGSFVAKYMP